jgi:hypothetical protein
MFSLGIYDKLTPGPLAGGHEIAGTGTIDDQGQVGPIGGIRQKLAGARSDGAAFFLAPADNCNEVVGHVPDGLEVFKVATFDDARTAVEAIAKGQWEASASLGMGYLQQMRWVILPQAFKIAIPPTVGFSVQVVKSTSLTSIIGFVELSKAGTVVTNATFEPFTVYGFVALIYFALCWPLSKTSQVLERKLNVAHFNH